MKILKMKMSDVMSVLAFVLVVFIWGLSDAIPQENEKPSASAEIGIVSKYVWRGYEFSKSSIVIQPSATLSFKGLGFNLWGNLDTDKYGDPHHKSQFSESDLTLSYGQSYGALSLGVGYIYYGLDGVDDSEEIYLSLGLDTLLAPTLTLYREVAHLPAWYISAGVSHSFELPQNMTLDLSGSLAYYASDDDNFTEIDSGLNATTEKYKSFHNGLITVGLTMPVGEYFTITPKVAYSFALTDEAEYLIAFTNGFSDDSDYVFGGVTLSMSF